METDKKIWVVAAAYNEEKTLADVIVDLKNHKYNNILVVDDGSSDKTSKIARELDVKVIKHIINRGQGASLKTGIEYALRENADIIITFDADGQMLAKDLDNLVEPVLKDEFDIKDGDIVQRSDISIFKVISNRYTQSGLKAIFSGDKKDDESDD